VYLHFHVRVYENKCTNNLDNFSIMTRVFLVTANVGSVFENVSAAIWIYQLVS